MDYVEVNLQIRNVGLSVEGLIVDFSSFLINLSIFWGMATN